MMAHTHHHPCRYCQKSLECDGDPEYADGYEGAFCSEEARDPWAIVCDDCATINWCGMCGEIEALPDSTTCAACVEDDDA